MQHYTTDGCIISGGGVLLSNTLLRTDKELREIYDRNFDTLYRISYMYMKNRCDAEDIVQNTFIKLFEKEKQFDNTEHEKAWLIVVTINACKNHFKTWWNTKVTYEDVEMISHDKNNYILEALLELPKKYKEVIYLYYYEGYSTKEIAVILNSKDATVRSQLQRAKLLLKDVLKGEKL